MKFWEMWIFTGVAAFLIICSVAILKNSSASHFKGSLDTGVLEKYLTSGNELHLSKEQTKQLIQLSIDAATHQNKGMKSLGKSLKYFSELLFIVGVAQLYLCFKTYKKMKDLGHYKSLE